MARQPRDPAQALKDLLFKGMVLMLIGAIVLIAPAFMGGSGFRQAIAGSSLVGWFALILGIAFTCQWAWHRSRK
ncbi:MAG: hypothetical protein ABI907_02470 [Ramlibacter sp.]